MTKYITLIPAYGRDYTSAAKMVADYKNGVDFLDSETRQYANKEDIERYFPGAKVNGRYAKLTKVCNIVK